MVNLDTDTHTQRMPCEHRGRDWGDASKSQGTPKIASNSLEARREAQNRVSLTASEGTSSDGTLILDSEAPEL